MYFVTESIHPLSLIAINLIAISAVSATNAISVGFISVDVRFNNVTGSTLKYHKYLLLANGFVLLVNVKYGLAMVVSNLSGSKSAVGVNHAVEVLIDEVSTQPVVLLITVNFIG